MLGSSERVWEEDSKMDVCKEKKISDKTVEDVGVEEKGNSEQVWGQKGRRNLRGTAWKHYNDNPQNINSYPTSQILFKA